MISILRALPSLVALGALLLASPRPLTAQSPCAVEDLAWMAGHWASESDGTRSEEGWFAPAGGILVGLHRDVRPDGRAFFEYLRIESGEDGVAYVASPMGRPGTPFALVACGDARAEFENPEHDFPQRIVYAVEGDELVARIEGRVDGESRSSEWRWRRMP